MPSSECIVMQITDNLENISTSLHPIFEGGYHQGGPVDILNQVYIRFSS